MVRSTSTKKHLVKRKGHKEKYDEKKVYASVYSAGINCHFKEKAAEKLAEQMMKKVNSWIKKKKEVDSKDIREYLIKNIPDQDVVVMYKHHLDIC